MRRSAVAFLFFAAACGAGDPCGEPKYAGNGTDEAWRTMVDARARVTAGGAQAPSFTTPAEGQVLAKAGGPPRIAWSSPLARKPAGVRAPHLPPVTDDVYLVEITVPGQECPVDLLTTNLEWQLSDAEWAVVAAAAPGSVSVHLIGAYLLENRITEGPFSPAAPLTLRVE
jgi:hypothetical protein